MSVWLSSKATAAEAVSALLVAIKNRGTLAEVADLLDQELARAPRGDDAEFNTVKKKKRKK